MGECLPNEVKSCDQYVGADRNVMVAESSVVSGRHSEAPRRDTVESDAINTVVRKAMTVRPSLVQWGWRRRSKFVSLMLLTNCCLLRSSGRAHRTHRPASQWCATPCSTSMIALILSSLRVLARTRRKYCTSTYRMDIGSCPRVKF
jgi:hypothetical protein